MSNNPYLDKYLELYSQYVSDMVELHNSHHTFLRHMGYRSHHGVRRAIRELIKLERELSKHAFLAYDEHMKQQRKLRDEKREIKAEKQKLKAIKRGTYAQYNRTIKDDV